MSMNSQRAGSSRPCYRSNEKTMVRYIYIDSLRYPTYASAKSQHTLKLNVIPSTAPHPDLQLRDNIGWDASGL